MVCAACAEPPSCECVEVSVLRINDAQLRTDVRRTIGLSYDECLVFPGRQASEVGQEVVDERDRLDGLQCLGLRAERRPRRTRCDHAFDWKAKLSQIPKSSALE